MSETELTNKMNSQSNSIAAWMMQRYSGTKESVGFQKSQASSSSDAFSTIFQQATRTTQHNDKQDVNLIDKVAKRTEFQKASQKSNEPLKSFSEKRVNDNSDKSVESKDKASEPKTEKLTSIDNSDEEKPVEEQEKTLVPAMEQLASLLQQMIEQIKAAMQESENVTDKEEQLPVLKVLEQLQQTISSSDDLPGVNEKLMPLLKNATVQIENNAQQIVTTEADNSKTAFTELESLLKEFGIQLQQVQQNGKETQPIKLVQLIQKMEAVADTIRSYLTEGMKNSSGKSDAKSTLEAIAEPVKIEGFEPTSVPPEELQRTGMAKQEETTLNVVTTVQDTIPKTQTTVPVQINVAGIQTFAGESRMNAMKADVEMVQPKGQAFSTLLNGLETGKSVTDQVVGKLQVYAETGKHEMELLLKPESLGKINMKLIEEKGQILAKFTAESEQVRAILESNMQLLKDALEKNGLSVQQLSVSVGNGKQEQAQEKANRDRQTQTVIHSQTTVQTDMFAKDASQLSGRVYDYLFGTNSTVSFSA